MAAANRAAFVAAAVGDQNFGEFFVFGVHREVSSEARWEWRRLGDMTLPHASITHGPAMTNVRDESSAETRRCGENIRYVRILRNMRFCMYEPRPLAYAFFFMGDDLCDARGNYHDP